MKRLESHLVFNRDAPAPNNIEDLKIVIGHSVQNSDQTVDKVFDKCIESNENTITFEHTGTVRFGNIDKRNHYNFNLTTECNANQNYNEIFRVDAGASRAMDLVTKISEYSGEAIIKHLDFFTNHVIIAPQVLKIVFADNADTKIYLIRATDSRTRTHVPRPWWEEKLKVSNIKQKYLKYKTKYLKLKNNV